jgi:hypothetical protein
MTSTSQRLQKLKEILTQSVGQVEVSADIFRLSQTNGHSKKELDI